MPDQPLPVDDLKPTSKDPAEGGAPQGDRGPSEAADRDEGHLGRAGDPAEG